MYSASAGHQCRAARDHVVNKHNSFRVFQRALHRERFVVLPKRRAILAARALGNGTNTSENRRDCRAESSTDQSVADTEGRPDRVRPRQA